MFTFLKVIIYILSQYLLCTIEVVIVYCSSQYMKAIVVSE